MINLNLSLYPDLVREHRQARLAEAAHDRLVDEALRARRPATRRAWSCRLARLAECLTWFRTVKAA